MNLFLSLWHCMASAAAGAAAALAIAGGLAVIFGAVFFSVFKIKKIHPDLAILASTVISCFAMIPVISAFNNLVRLKAEGAAIDAGKAQISAQAAEVERLKAEARVKSLEREKLEQEIAMAKQSIELEALDDAVKLLENARLSLRSFEKILEVALLQTDLNQTAVRKEPLNPVQGGLGLRASYYQDEALVVITHDITAKFGVDLNAVKIAKLDEDTVVVSGIRPKLIGTSKNISNVILKEYRRLNYKGGVLDSVDAKYDSQSRERVDRLAQRYQTEFQRKLSGGLELEFMNSAVAQLAENFIKVMFAPLYQNIRFTDAGESEGLPLAEYLEKELTAVHDRKNELAALSPSDSEAAAAQIRAAMP
ncbi:MAG: hypothetical protein LBD13_03965 [Spirochaetaceae bacterium]|jgi:hypothetical protein|nr:hypothetical protein [Spirochaetaceae bacterium]